VLVRVPDGIEQAREDRPRLADVERAIGKPRGQGRALDQMSILKSAIFLLSVGRLMPRMRAA
jgi:hypothetical protein